MLHPAESRGKRRRSRTFSETMTAQYYIVEDNIDERAVTCLFRVAQSCRNQGIGPISQWLIKKAGGEATKMTK